MLCNGQMSPLSIFVTAVADYLHQVARFRENPLDHFEIAGVKREAKDTGVLSDMPRHPRGALRR